MSILANIALIISRKLPEMATKNRRHAAALSLQRLMSLAGEEFGGDVFRMEDVNRLNLSADFKRAMDDGLLVFVSNPDWYEPTVRGAVALRSLA